VISTPSRRWRPLAEDKGQRIEVAFADGLLPLNGDRSASPSVQQSPEQRLQVHGERGTIRVVAERHGGGHGLVTDSGIGIPPEKLGAIFEMFHQLETFPDRSGTGLGIGLTLARRLVELHEGPSRRAVRDRAGKRVRRAPAHAPDAADAPEEAAVAPAAGPRRPFACSSSTTTRTARLPRRAALPRRHETRVAHDGLEAVDTAEQFRPDVVLLDIGLPKLSGLDAAASSARSRGVAT